MLKNIAICVLVILTFVVIPVAFAGRVELTTYYPAPYGEYKNLKSTEGSNFATSSGFVGIGTTAPADKLHLYSSSGNAYLRTEANNGLGSHRTYTFGSNTTDYNLHIRDATGNWDILTALYSNGCVGIGTTNPIRALHVNGEVSITRSDRVAFINVSDPSGNNGGTIWLRGLTSNGSASTDATVLISGKVGIGTTGPSWPLHVVTSSGNAIRGESQGVGMWGKGVNDGVYGEGGLRGVTGSGSMEGVRGSGASGAYDFYAAGPGTNYGPFTGAHEVKLSYDFPKDVREGLIISVTGKVQIRKDEKGKISISSTLPTIKLSNKPNDKNIFGVLISQSPFLPQDHWYKAKKNERFGIVNALGEGRVWVSNFNGDIRAGDYITTSSIPGYGQKQDDDILHSYTLGKATEDVDWEKVSETVKYNGKTYKTYLIGVVYTSG